jgi:hypothetical protein
LAKSNFFDIYTQLSTGKKLPKVWATSAIFAKLPRGSNRQIGLNLPNLVTLIRKLKKAKFQYIGQVLLKDKLTFQWVVLVLPATP